MQMPSSVCQRPALAAKLEFDLCIYITDIMQTSDNTDLIVVVRSLQYPLTTQLHTCREPPYTRSLSTSRLARGRVCPDSVVSPTRSWLSRSNSTCCADWRCSARHSGTHAPHHTWRCLRPRRRPYRLRHSRRHRRRRRLRRVVRPAPDHTSAVRRPPSSGSADPTEVAPPPSCRAQSLPYTYTPLPYAIPVPPLEGVARSEGVRATGDEWCCCKLGRCEQGW